MDRSTAETIEQGSFVQLRGRQWLVEALRGDGTDPTVKLSCIADDAQGEQIEVLWDAEIGASVLEEDTWRTSGRGCPDSPEVLAAYCERFAGVRRLPPTAICCRRRSAPASGSMPISFCRCAKPCGCRGSIF